MIDGSITRLLWLCGGAIAALAMLAPASHAQVAPVPYLNAGSFGLDGNADTQYWGEAPDADGFRKGFAFRGFSTPVSAFGSGLSWGPIAASPFSFSGLTSEGGQYSYSFKGAGEIPVTLFGGVTTLRTNPDVFTSLVTPGFARNNTLATGFNAGVEFKPAPNLSLSFSAGYVQPAAPVATDLRSQLLSGAGR
jgi:hypothetical protein